MLWSLARESTVMPDERIMLRKRFNQTESKGAIRMPAARDVRVS